MVWTSNILGTIIFTSTVYPHIRELISAFDKTFSQNQKDQDEAKEYIDNFIQRDLETFLKYLSDILVGVSNQAVVRLAAGLQLKNQLSAKIDAIREKRIQTWQNLPQESRDYIKERVFNALGTEELSTSSAPSCVAAIAAAELPTKQWPGLIESLVDNITSQNSSNPLRLASLECLGQICNEIDQANLDKSESESILDAIIQSMQVAEKSDNTSNNAIVQAATAAVSNYFEPQLKEISRTHQLITYKELGERLNVDVKYAERIVAQMIREERLQGSLDQVTQKVFFETKDSTQKFDDDVLKVCSEVNEIVDRIKNVVPHEWWTANFQAAE